MSLTDAQKAALRDHRSPEALIAFLTLTHPGLSEPVRVVRNTADMIKGGDLFRAVMFDMALVTDGDLPPRTELRIPNVDHRIGAAVRAMRDRARVLVELCLSSDFDETAAPHTEVGTAAIIYSLAEFEVLQVSVTASDIAAQVGLRDYSQEPWPYLRATQNRLPGLFV
jgi:hypothetical protein